MHECFQSAALLVLRVDFRRDELDRLRHALRNDDLEILHYLLHLRSPLHRRDDQVFERAGVLVRNGEHVALSFQVIGTVVFDVVAFLACSAGLDVLSRWEPGRVLLLLFLKLLLFKIRVQFLNFIILFSFLFLLLQVLLVRYHFFVNFGAVFCLLNHFWTAFQEVLAWTDAFSPFIFISYLFINYFCRFFDTIYFHELILVPILLGRCHVAFLVFFFAYLISFLFFLILFYWLIRHGVSSSQILKNLCVL